MVLCTCIMSCSYAMLYEHLWFVSWAILTKGKFWYLCLVLVGDVAGDVGGDREVLDQAGVDLADEYNSADAEENEVLELFQKL